MPSQPHSAKPRPTRPSQPRRSSPSRRRLPILLVLGIAVVAVLLLAAGGFTFAATQEQHDAFCASCHTQPESTFYARSTAAQPADLASYHTAKDTKCINCHSGVGVTGRLSAELMGARNAAAWYTGVAVQPARVTFPINDPNCLKCHQEVTASRNRNNHFHYFLARWQASDPNAGHCVSCHPGHSTEGNADTGYQVEAQTQAACDACHQAIRGNEED